MTGTGLSGIGCVAAVSKSVLQIIEQGFLIGFYREVIMGFTFFDEVSGESALGEYGISGNDNAVNINRCQQWDSRFDFIGWFYCVIVTVDFADFFWV